MKKREINELQMKGSMKSRERGEDCAVKRQFRDSEAFIFMAQVHFGSVHALRWADVGLR
jgi:hypothetical protein